MTLCRDSLTPMASHTTRTTLTILAVCSSTGSLAARQVFRPKHRSIGDQASVVGLRTMLTREIALRFLRMIAPANDSQ